MSIVGVEAAERPAPRIIIAIAGTMQVPRGRKGWRVAASVSLADDIICHCLLERGRFYFLRFRRFRVIWRRHLADFTRNDTSEWNWHCYFQKYLLPIWFSEDRVIFVTSVECLFHGDKVERNSFLSIRDKKVHLIFYIATVFCSSVHIKISSRIKHFEFCSPSTTSIIRGLISQWKINDLQRNPRKEYLH